jgi:hypothetical protein
MPLWVRGQVREAGVQTGSQKRDVLVHRGTKRGAQ